MSINPKPPPVLLFLALGLEKGLNYKGLDMGAGSMATAKKTAKKALKKKAAVKKKTAAKKSVAKKPAAKKKSPARKAAVGKKAPARQQRASASTPDGTRLEISTSRMFAGWLAQQDLSLAFTTYQAHKLFFVGRQPDGRIGFEERTLPRCMGLTIDGDDLAVTSQNMIWRFRNLLRPGQTHDGYDRIFAPRISAVTGDVDAHDIAFDADGGIVFINTLFGCLAQVSEKHSFDVIWKPPFLSRLVPEDRCHLNGLAMVNGRPKFVTAVSESDVADGWRDNRIGGGIIIDIQTNDIVCRDLSMPHSPRWHDGMLWFVEGGTGYLCKLDVSTSIIERIAFCPGFLRGLAFHGAFAIVGLSLPRRDGAFKDLPLDDELAQKKAEPRCGLQIIDTRTGALTDWIRIDGLITELFDVAVLPGAVRPRAVGFKDDEINRVLHLPPEIA